jgi:hypothetical protein
LVVGCNAQSKPIDPNDPVVPDPNPMPKPDPDPMPDPNGLPPVVASSKARLQFKGGEVYAAALSNGLAIPRAELCKELGLYDCVADVHRIALLDVEPYKVGILEPLDNSVVSTPIAVERVALTACTDRARRDRADPAKAEVFTFDADAAGAIADLEAPAVVASIETLYRRLLSRDPDPREVDHLRALYRSMAEVGDPALGEAWAAMSCFAVATSVEALFY